MGQHLQAEAFPEGNKGGVIGIRELLGDGCHRHSGHTPKPPPGPSCRCAAGRRQLRSCVGVPHCRLVDGADPTPNLGSDQAGSASTS